MEQGSGEQQGTHESDGHCTHVFPETQRRWENSRKKRNCPSITGPRE
jgi:hypothetical protein